jgi:hypothetical protein
VKKFWLENQPPDGGTLAASYHAIRKQNDLERQQIESGLFDDDAQDEANRSNIERLRAAGFVQDAAALQTERNSYRARVAATNAQSAANRVPGPTQRDGRPLPRNWIDPNQADANFHAEQIEREARRLRQQIEELNNRLRR